MAMLCSVKFCLNVSMLVNLLEFRLAGVTYALTSEKLQHCSETASLSRQGVAGQLLRACEAVGAAAGFWTFYIQADTEQHNHSTFLPFDTKQYNAAINAYKKAGYREYLPKVDWKQVALWTQTAKLMYKTFRP